MTRYKLLGSIALFSAGFAAHYALVNHNPTAADGESTAGVNDQAYITKINTLNNHITLLEDRIKTLEDQQYRSATHNPSSGDLSPRSTPSGTSTTARLEDKPRNDQEELKKLQAFKIDHQVEDFQNWYNAVKVNGIQTEMDSKFLNEETDYLWAKEREEKLNTLFTDNEYLTEFSVVTNDCKSTLCRISIMTPDASRMTQLSNSLSQALYKNGTGDDMGSFITVVEPDSGLTHVYISRSEENFQSMLQNPLPDVNRLKKSH